MTKKTNIFSSVKADFGSGLVVFLVALPLCLGIALASGAPLFSGIISGVVGGVVVGFLSKSHISVSGPAAGLTAIVLTAITDLGAFDIFLTAVLIAGIIQIALGFINAGIIANYTPNNIIEGMLAGIGVIIILKQLPHAFGYDKVFEGDESFIQMDGGNTITSLLSVFDYVLPGAIITTIISLSILILWEKVPFLKNVKLIPAALVAVFFSVVLNEVFVALGSSLAITDPKHLVSLPIPESIDELKAIIITPNFGAFTNPKVWSVAVTIAIVASIETLLSLEAADRLDKQKRYSDPNTELKAQGIGNILSSLIGGLPMTSVVVRSSANSNAGAKTKLSAVIHGLLLLISVLLIPTFLNKIPLAALAAILLLVGYKLAKPKTFKHFYKGGKYQFYPFMGTFLAVIFIDLLKGVIVGSIICVIFILRGNMKRAYHFRKEEYENGDIIHIDLAQEVSFLNKAAIKAALYNLPENSRVIINAKHSEYIAHDILDLIKEFKKIVAKERNIKVKLQEFKKEYDIEEIDNTQNHIKIEHHYDVKTRKITEKKHISTDFI